MDKKYTTLMLLILLMVGCSPRATVQVELGSLLYSTTFDSPIQWDNRQQGAVSIGVADSAYRMTADTNQFVMGFGVGDYTDVVITVDANQLSAHPDNAYGVACRASLADGSTNGYYFLIGGDGSASLRIGRGGEIKPIIAWYRTPLVNGGVAVNRLKVMCVGDYLALYANDNLIYEMRDTTYATGYVGFLVAAETGSVVEIAFDNLFVHEGVISQ
ncbi:MAG: hypothetical protein SH821_13290 [Phototrophicales bacterium]|nr:hypothetical protein [Phototrophicales bacterium]